MLKIKSIMNSQFFYGKDKNGEPYEFRAYGDPFFVDGVWNVEATDAGDYCYTFTEEDEEILYAAEEVGDEIVDYYEDEEYGESMQSLENMLLAGDLGVDYNE